MFRFLLVLLLLCGVGCSESTAPDAGSDVDASAATDSGIDAGRESDAGIDAGADGGGSDAGAETDGGRDAGTGPDAGSDAGDCTYLDLSIWISDCGDGYQYVRRWTDTGGVCPEYYTIDGMRFPTLEEALASKTCTPDCLRAPSTSVTVLRCGHRSGYIVYEDSDMSCPAVYETPDGLFESIAAWDAAAPCP